MSKNNGLFIFVLVIGFFAILNTEMGVVGILPLISDNFHVSISQAGLLVSLFALAIAVSAPITPMLFSGINRKTAMVFVLVIFLLGNVVSMFTSNFAILLIARAVPAFFHPVYCSLAFTIAAASVSKEEEPKAISKVMMGVSAGMVLGAPVSSFIASSTSLKMAMLFFAVVTAISLIATIIFIPSMPVRKKLSYGTQLRILKRGKLWLSIAAVICLNAGMYGVFSFYAEYLRVVTNIPIKAISLILLIYGISTILGNILGGKSLSKDAITFVKYFPFIFGLFYLVLFFIGRFMMPTIILTVIAGTLVGAGNNITQYWLISSAPDTPEFTNGIYLSAGNIGVMIGITICGFVISGLGIKYVMLGGTLFIILNSVFVYIRNAATSSEGKVVLD